MSAILLILAIVILFGWRAPLSYLAGAWAVLSKPSRSWDYARAVVGALLIVGAVALSVPGPPATSAPAVREHVLTGTRAEVYDAVKAFQKANGLRVDGVVGPETFPKLYKAR
jgi:hypothetical protein